MKLARRFAVPVVAGAPEAPACPSQQPLELNVILLGGVRTMEDPLGTNIASFHRLAHVEGCVEGRALVLALKPLSHGMNYWHLVRIIGALDTIDAALMAGRGARGGRWLTSSGRVYANGCPGLPFSPVVPAEGSRRIEWALGATRGLVNSKGDDLVRAVEELAAGFAVK